MKLPDFPWDTLLPYKEKASSHPDGLIDLSVGTPVDPTPDFIQSALRDASNAPGYPLTIGTPELRTAMRSWAEKILGARGEFDVLPTIGSKELVAWLPTFLQSKKVIYPDIAYPTYLVGSLIAHAEATAVEINPTSWPQADLAWINTPSNPTGRVHSESELKAVINHARANNLVLASDECYLNFPANPSITPISILRAADGNNKNLLAVYSLSKRSNFAGYRGGLIVGDPDLISTIREFRKHAGMLVPLPVQKAMTVALQDENHVHEQADRYAKRREKMRTALESAGFTIEHSEAGLYIWCTRGEEDLVTITWLSERGILAAPGRFYGPAGSNYVRIAMTSTDLEIEKAASRIAGK